MDKRFIVNLKGREFVTYQGLLDEAHQQGLKSIETSILQLPTADNGNAAVCQAVVETERGRFSGIGDADPTNVGAGMRPHIIRLAETRAKARALRDAVNVGMAALEELAEDEPAPQRPAPQQPQAKTPQPQPQARYSAQPSDPARATEKQVRAIYGIGSRLDMSEQQIVEQCERTFGAGPSELTRSDASQVIELLNAEVLKQKQLQDEVSRKGGQDADR